MTRFNLRTALGIAFAAVSILMAASVSVLLDRLATTSAKQDIGDALYALSGRMYDELQNGLAERLRDVTIIAHLKQFRDADTPNEDNRAVLQQLRQNYSEYAWIGVAKPDGKVLYAADHLLDGANVLERPWFRAALIGPFIGDVHEAKLLAKLLPAPGDGEPLRFLDVASPIYDAKGRLLNVIGAHLSWEWARNVERKVFGPVSAGGVETFMLSQSGKVLLAPKGLEGISIPPLPADVQSSVIRWPDGKEYLTTIRRSQQTGPQDLGWQIVVRQSTERAFAPVQALRHAILWTGAGCAFLFACLGVLIANRISRPLQKLSDAADALREGNEAVEIPVSNAYQEVGHLSHSLRELILALSSKSEQLTTLNNTLETMVAARTQLLNTTNENLMQVLEERNALVAQLEELANTDVLTGVSNRRAFYEQAQQELKRIERNGKPLSAVAIDIDFFKRINDQEGHDIGDEVLQQMAATCRATLRDIDIFARFGGEEFVALLPDTDESGAALVAERLRAAIANIVIKRPDHLLQLTASFGVARLGSTEKLEALLTRADKALYEAKHTGRNRVVIAPALPELILPPATENP
ncbi:Response regulator PleD [Andreprevotia sp. IGB-42]|uniref:sensor domain-containing diguanylate cyclase n=1 Tax=Andreprevotia sp. IGB-42 TaxID=2497473 RepID=UPI00135CA017|nr:sensor domain-containing diguanylate cyclase [Andreprevotia sp. IGB-42]KAF0814091.1 Response regulator PleD [Andreprevotia sp. IGB-42]